jgi:hypothetical protein
MSDVQGDRWLTYVELGLALGISPSAARMHATRRGWLRRSPNKIGAHAMVLVPENIVVPPCAPAEQRTFDELVPQPPNGHDDIDPSHAPAIRAAIEALREQLAVANRRIDALDEERRLLFSLLTAEHKPWWRRWFR